MRNSSPSESAISSAARRSVAAPDGAAEPPVRFAILTGSLLLLAVCRRCNFTVTSQLSTRIQFLEDFFRQRRIGHLIHRDRLGDVAVPFISVEQALHRRKQNSPVLE